MDPREIEAIAVEVARRVTALVQRKSALVLTVSPQLCPGGSAYLQRLKKNEIYVTRLVHKGEEECSCHDCVTGTVEMTASFDAAAMASLVAAHDEVVVTGATIAQLSAVRDLRISRGVTELMCEALRQGKKLTVFTPAFDCHKAAKAFAGRLNALKSELEGYGMRFNTVPAPETSGTRMLDKNVINKQDLVDITEDSIVVGKNAVLTATAKKLLSDRHIEVIYR